MDYPTGCSGGAASAESSPSPTVAEVSGGVALASGAYLSSDPSCTAGDGYGDIAAGAEVDILDNGGKVVGVGHLADGTISDTGTCHFDFTVPDVPNGGSIYGVKVGNANRGVVHFSKAEMFGGGAELTIGG